MRTLHPRAHRAAPVLVFVFLSLIKSTSTAISNSPLQFRKDGTFKIVQFTDMHYGEDKSKDQKTRQVQTEVLQQEQPDLVVLSGDMVSGYAWDGKQGWFEKQWGQLIRAMEDAGIPYATTLGNHDDEADLDRREIVDLEHRLTDGNLSCTRMGPAHVTGATNYYLDILSPSDGTSAAQPPTTQHRQLLKPITADGIVEQQLGDGMATSNDAAGREGVTEDAGGHVGVTEMGTENARVAARLWFLDSMDRVCRSVPGWGCVGDDTLQWALAVEQQLPSVRTKLLFSHIPVPEYMTVWNIETTWGHKEEAVNCPAVEPQTFGFIKAMGIGAMYCGHDHDNDYYGSLSGTRLAYGRKTGYGSYGPPAGWLRGARVIVLREGQAAEHSDTWLRLESGGKEQQGKSSKSWWWPFKQYVCESVAGHSWSVMGSTIVMAHGGGDHYHGNDQRLGPTPPVPHHDKHQGDKHHSHHGEKHHTHHGEKHHTGHHHDRDNHLISGTAQQQGGERVHAQQLSHAAAAGACPASAQDCNS